MTSGTPASTAARNGTRSSATGPGTVAGASSVLTGESPSPGKCLAVAATPAPRIPSTEARTRAAIPRGPPANAREAITEPGPGTSATGARFTFTPAADSCRAAARAAVRTWSASPWKRCPASGPACSTVRISPPSWSTMTSARPRPPAQVVRPDGLVEARDRELADLLAERQPVGRAERGRLPALGGRSGGVALRRAVIGARAKHQADDERDERAQAQGGQPPPRGRVTRESQLRARPAWPRRARRPAPRFPPRHSPPRERRGRSRPPGRARRCRAVRRPRRARLPTRGCAP